MRVSRGTCYLRNKLWTINYAVNGKRTREAVGTDRKLALQVLAKRTSSAVEGREFDKRPQAKAVTFNQLCDLYLTRHVNALKSAQRERDRVEARRKQFGSRALASITTAELLDWRASKLANRKPATVNRDMMRLKSMLGRAVEWDMLNDNPARGIRPLKENNKRERYLTVEECARLISACTPEESTRECPGSAIRPLVTVALHTGMRLGEILNLKWADVDWQRGQLAIRDSKNGEGRVVPLDGTVLGLLKTRRGARDTSPRPACKDNTFPLQGVIFGSPSGGRLTTVRRAFRTACRRSGLADLHFHDLRHTFASLFMQSGGNLYALQKLLGHRSIKMTERYSHLSPGHLKSEVERMQEMWVEVPVRN